MVKSILGARFQNWCCRRWGCENLTHLFLLTLPPPRRRPVKRERVLEPAIYAASAVSGLICCSAMHLVTVPVDVIKTRMQSPGTPRADDLRNSPPVLRWRICSFTLVPARACPAPTLPGGGVWLGASASSNARPAGERHYT